MSNEETPGVGHNSGIAGAKLKAYLERVERLEEEIKSLQDDRKEVYAEAKGNGFDAKVLRRLVALRRIDTEERAEFVAIMEIYAQAIGMGNVFA